MGWHSLALSVVAFAAVASGAQGNQTGDTIPAFTAAVAVLDSICTTPEADCRSVEIHRFVRRLRTWLPLKSDSLGGSFELSAAVPGGLTDRWPMRVADLGTDYAPGDSTVHMWLFLIGSGQKTPGTRRFTVATYVPRLEARIALVKVRISRGRWIVESVNWAAT